MQSLLSIVRTVLVQIAAIFILYKLWLFLLFPDDLTKQKWSVFQLHWVDEALSCHSGAKIFGEN